jgi:hypothetical protein
MSEFSEASAGLDSLTDRSRICSETSLQSKKLRCGRGGSGSGGGGGGGFHVEELDVSWSRRLQLAHKISTFG